jgi:ribosome silencing factor RsfS/YbeB/iojap
MITRTRLRPKKEERAPPLQNAVTTALDDMKAVNVRVLDVRGLTDIADTMVIASGNSDRHVRSIAERVVESAKAAGFRPLLRPRTAVGRRPGAARSCRRGACARQRTAAHLPVTAKDARARDRGGHAHACLGARRMR